MGNEIQVGMSYGSYDGMVKELSEKYTKTENDKAYEKGYESELLFTDRGQVKANGYRKFPTHKDSGKTEYGDAVIFNGRLEYGIAAKSIQELNVFDYIRSAKQFAIDMNGNGIVDKNEIFNGDLNRYIYKRAKESGDLNKYQEIRSKYNF